MVGQYPAQPSCPSVIKWIVLNGQNNLVYGPKTRNPERAGRAHLAHSGSQTEHRVRFTLPSRGTIHSIECARATDWSPTQSLGVTHHSGKNVTCRRFHRRL